MRFPKSSWLAILLMGGIASQSHSQVVWTRQNSGDPNALHNVIWTGNGLIAVGRYTFTMLTSPDGVTWTSRQTASTGGAGAGFNGVASRNGQAVAFSWADLKILTSSDEGATWTPRFTIDSDSVGYYMNTAAWTGTRWVSVGLGGLELVSPDGITWTPQATGIGTDLFYLAWTGTQLAAVGASGTIFTSPDGSAWTPRSSGTDRDFRAVVWGGNRFVAVGVSGLIATSPDGIAWTMQNSGTTNDVNGICWTGSQFVAVGGDPNALTNNVVLSSPDGLTWKARTTGSTDILQDVAWTGTRLVAVGQFGTVLTSPQDLTPVMPDRARKGAAAAGRAVYDLRGARRGDASAASGSTPAGKSALPPGAYVLKER